MMINLLHLGTIVLCAFIVGFCVGDIWANITK